MVRLIDADKIEYRADDSRMKPFDYVYRCDVEAEPTVDAEPVIRCGVCRRKRYCSFYRETNDENGFCSWAEGKEE